MLTVMSVSFSERPTCWIAGLNIKDYPIENIVVLVLWSLQVNYIDFY